jgi:hypothetical protein
MSDQITCNVVFYPISYAINKLQYYISLILGKVEIDVFYYPLYLTRMIHDIS